jgi:hypothetical protein
MGVPELDAARLHDPHLAQIGAHDVALEIVDQRVHGRDPEGKAVANVREALTERLGRAGVIVKPDSAAHLVVALRNVEQPPEGFSDDACILVACALQVPRGTAQSHAFACYEYRHLLGFSLGVDATPAYESALNGTLDELARVAAQLAR